MPPLSEVPTQTEPCSIVLSPKTTTHPNPLVSPSQTLHGSPLVQRITNPTLTTGVALVAFGGSLTFSLFLQPSRQRLPVLPLSGTCANLQLPQFLFGATLTAELPAES